MMIQKNLIPKAIALALIIKTTLANNNSTAPAALAVAPANVSVNRSPVSTAIKCLPRRRAWWCWCY